MFQSERPLQLFRDSFTMVEFTYVIYNSLFRVYFIALKTISFPQVLNVYWTGNVLFVFAGSLEVYVHVLDCCIVLVSDVGRVILTSDDVDCSKV